MVVLTNANDIELKPAFQQLSLDLRCNAVETDMAPGINGLRWSVPLLHRRHLSSAVIPGCGDIVLCVVVESAQ